MNTQYQAGSTYFLPLNKMSRAIALTIGLSTISVQAWAQTHISSNQTTPVVVNGTSVIVDPNVQINVNSVTPGIPAMTISNGGSVSILAGSSVNGTNLADGVLINVGSFTATGASLSTNGLGSDALQLEGGSIANITNTNLTGQGVNAHALMIEGGTAAISNTATVTGGTLSSAQAEAVLLQGNNANATLNNTNVSGVTAVHLTGGAAAANIATVNNSTLTGTTGTTVLLDGANTVLNLNNSTVSSNANTTTVSVGAAGNVLNVTNGSITNVGAAGGGGAALAINGGTGNLDGTSITANGAGVKGVYLNSGNLNLNNVNIATTGNSAHGISELGAANSLNITGGSVTTQGSVSAGVNVLNGLTASISGTTVVTRGDTSAGVNVSNGAKATLDRVTVSARGNDSIGVNVDAGSRLDVSNSRIDVTGTQTASNVSALAANGVNALLNSSNVTANAKNNVTGLIAANGAIVTVTGGTTTTENGAGAIVSNGSVANIRNGATIATTGSSATAHALLITGGSTAAMNQVTIDGSTLSTQNAQADLIRANGGVANVLIKNGATINTSGNILNLQNNGGVASRVNLTADGVNLKGNIIANATSVGNVFLQNGTTLTGMIDPVALTIDGTSTWNVTANSDVSALTLNGGKVVYQAPVGNTFKTVTADSLAGTAGRITMNTRLGNTGSPTDLLKIAGNSSGAHQLTINNVGGKGAMTSGDGIRVVQIEGSSPTNNFTLANGPLEVGAYEYFLNQGAPTRASDWYLRSTFRAAVPGYLLTPGLNQEYGYSTLGTLQERAGDFGNIARSEKQTQPGNGVWGRAQASQYNKDAHDALGASVHDNFLQFGKDWTLTSNADGSSTHAGATVTLGQSSARFYDEKRALLNPVGGNGTGKVDTDATGIGGYWTAYRADGSYLDLVGQATLYRNKYQDNAAHAASNKATGVALSAEVGKPFAVSESMRIEPQAQLIYQYLNSKSFNDYMSTISAKTSNAVRGRLGVRLFREMATAGEPRSPAPYLTLDVLHNFTNPVTVNVGDDALQANENKTWGEIGTGISGRVSKQGQLSAALKYRHQLSGQTHEGVAGQVSYRYNW